MPRIAVVLLYFWAAACGQVTIGVIGTGDTGGRRGDDDAVGDHPLGDANDHGGDRVFAGGDCRGDAVGPHGDEYSRGDPWVPQGDATVPPGDSCSIPGQCECPYEDCGIACCAAGQLCGEGGCSTSLPEVPAEIIKVSWNYREGAEYSLDVKPVGGAKIPHCVSAQILGTDHLSFIFNGTCPNATGGPLTVDAVDYFQIWSCEPAGGGCWGSAATTKHQATSTYTGGSSVHVDLPGSRVEAGVLLRWPTIPGAEYCLHLRLRDGGGRVDNCANAGVVGEVTEYFFNGWCPSKGRFVPLSDIASFEINSSIIGPNQNGDMQGQWADGYTRDAAVVAFDGSAEELEFSFDKFRNFYFEESCVVEVNHHMQFESGDVISSHTCRGGGGHRKRRLTNQAPNTQIGYPRSYYDADGQYYLLFQTSAGNFPSSGSTSGCPQLNLVRTADFKHYQFVAQVEHYCDAHRVNNGEINIIGGRMHIVYHTISPADGCGPGQRAWQIRLKVSDNYRSANPSFVNLAGAPQAEVLHQECINNDQLDKTGFWEPFIYRTDPGELRIVYADDMAPETSNDGQCNQEIYQFAYSETVRAKVPSSHGPIVACPGDRREGMPVVAKVPGGPYVMVIESLSGPRPEIVMFTSNDGKTWGNRSLVANTDHDGGKGVGCPYVVATNDHVYASFHHTYADSQTGRDYSHFQIRVLDKSLTKDSDNRLAKTRDIAFEMRPSKTTNNIGLYYWGSIKVVDDHVVGLAAGGTLHPPTEAWIPLH